MSTLMVFAEGNFAMTSVTEGTSWLPAVDKAIKAGIPLSGT